MNESSKRSGPTNESITRIFRLLEVVEQDILPLTREGVRAGNKIFGAAVLNKTDESLVVAGTNTELENPLWHGEVATIKRLYEMPQSNRPDPNDCLFLATHEPCSLCLSAITWAGFAACSGRANQQHVRRTVRHLPGLKGRSSNSAGVAVP